MTLKDQMKWYSSLPSTFVIYQFTRIILHHSFKDVLFNVFSFALFQNVAQDMLLSNLSITQLVDHLNENQNLKHLQLQVRIMQEQLDERDCEIKRLKQELEQKSLIEEEKAEPSSDSRKVSDEVIESEEVNT